MAEQGEVRSTVKTSSTLGTATPPRNGTFELRRWSAPRR